MSACQRTREVSSQFLRDYVDLPYFKDVRPEDIEDVSEQYVTLFAEERDSDRVKRVHIDGGSTLSLEHPEILPYASSWRKRA